jgi:hypothetical protein
MNDNQQAATFFAVILGVVVIFFAVILVIYGFICYLISSWLKKVPQQHRKMEPGAVWLLMIPCFWYIWSFFVFLRVPESFKSYFDSQGRTDVGDCGRTLGLAFAICFACTLVPYLNFIAGPASLVLLIINLVKFNELKNKIVAAPPAP